MPTDERMVSELSPRSNARLIRETLMQGPAAVAHFVDLYEPLIGARPARVAAALPIDVLVLGMGADMHTASLFPGAPELGGGAGRGRAGLDGDQPAGPARGAADPDRAGAAWRPRSSTSSSPAPTSWRRLRGRSGTARSPRRRCGWS